MNTIVDYLKYLAQFSFILLYSLSLVFIFLITIILLLSLISMSYNHFVNLFIYLLSSFSFCSSPSSSKARLIAGGERHCIQYDCVK